MNTFDVTFRVISAFISTNIKLRLHLLRKYNVIVLFSKTGVEDTMKDKVM